MKVRAEGYADGDYAGLLIRDPGARKVLRIWREDLRLAGLLVRCLVPSGPWSGLPVYVVGAAAFILLLAYCAGGLREPHHDLAARPFEAPPPAAAPVPDAEPETSGLDMVPASPLPADDQRPAPEPEPAAEPPRQQAVDWSQPLALAKEPPAAPLERPVLKPVSLPNPALSKVTSGVVFTLGRAEGPAAAPGRPAAPAAEGRAFRESREFRDLKGRMYVR